MDKLEAEEGKAPEAEITKAKEILGLAEAFAAKPVDKPAEKTE